MPRRAPPSREVSSLDGAFLDTDLPSYGRTAVAGQIQPTIPGHLVFDKR